MNEARKGWMPVWEVKQVIEYLTEQGRLAARHQEQADAEEMASDTASYFSGKAYAMAEAVAELKSIVEWYED